MDGNKQVKLKGKAKWMVVRLSEKLAWIEKGKEWINGWSERRKKEEKLLIFSSTSTKQTNKQERKNCFEWKTNQTEDIRANRCEMLKSEVLENEQEQTKMMVVTWWVVGGLNHGTLECDRVCNTWQRNIHRQMEDDSNTPTDGRKYINRFWRETMFQEEDEISFLHHLLHRRMSFAVTVTLTSLQRLYHQWHRRPPVWLFWKHHIAILVTVTASPITWFFFICHVNKFQRLVPLCQLITSMTTISKL